MAACQCCMDNVEYLNCGLCTHRCLVALKLPFGVRTNAVVFKSVHRTAPASPESFAQFDRQARTHATLAHLGKHFIMRWQKPLSQTPTTNLIAGAHRNIFGDGTTYSGRTALGDD